MPSFSISHMIVAKKIILMFQRLAKENKTERDTRALEYETISSLLMMRQFIKTEKLDVDKLVIIEKSKVSDGDAVAALMDIMDNPSKIALEARRLNENLQKRIRLLEQENAKLKMTESDVQKEKLIIEVLSIIEREGMQSTGSLADIMIGGVDKDGMVYQRLKSCWHRPTPLIEKVKIKPIRYDLTEAGRIMLDGHRTNLAA